MNLILIVVIVILLIKNNELKQEIESLKANGYDCSNLYISDKAHVIFPYHVLFDKMQEEIRNKIDKILEE